MTEQGFKPPTCGELEGNYLKIFHTEGTWQDDRLVDSQGRVLLLKVTGQVLELNGIAATYVYIIKNPDRAETVAALYGERNGISPGPFGYQALRIDHLDHTQAAAKRTLSPHAKLSIQEFEALEKFLQQILKLNTH